MARPKREVPWLDKRKNGYHYACWYDADKRRTRSLSLRTTNSAEAQAKFAEFLSQGADFYEAANGVSVREVLDFYEDEHVLKNVVATERFGYARTQLIGYFGETPIRDVNVEASQRYIAHRLGMGVGLSTIKRELVVLVAAANFNVKRRRISADDKPSIEYPKVEDSREVWLFKDEMRKYRDAKDQTLKDMIDTLYYTGSRRVAIEKLEWAQVDLDSKVIRLAKAGEVKTKKRRPAVPIVPELEAVLVRRFMSADNEYVFGHPGRRYKALINQAKRVGLLNLPARDGRPEGRFCPHAIRHTRATHMLQDGVDVYSVAKLLGDTVATVERTYGHASTSRTADAILKSGL